MVSRQESAPSSLVPLTDNLAPSVPLHTRRGVFGLGQGALALGLAGGMLGFIQPAAAARGVQSAWRYCNKCHQLFFDGYASKGRCAAGGGHVAQGYEFTLDHDDGQAQTAGLRKQYAWRFCTKCHTMFFDGYPAKGNCPGGGGHTAAGFMFGLTHDSAGAPGQQDWRFCHKCHAMFFDGYADKGRCSAGAGHAAAGFNFKLPFREAAPAAGSAQAIVAAAAQGAFNGNRGVMERELKNFLGRADMVGRGFTLHDINLRLGQADFKFTSPTVFRLAVNGNYMYFQSTQPTVFGSYADPAFEVHTDILVTGILVPPRRAGEKPRVEAVVLSVPRITVKGRNLTGKAGVAVASFFARTERGRALIKEATDKYLRVDLTQRINDALQRV